MRMLLGLLLVGCANPVMYPVGSYEPPPMKIYAAPFYEPYQPGIYEQAKTIETYQHLGELDY